MKVFIVVFSLLCFTIWQRGNTSSSSQEDVFLIYYATLNGNSGHIGIAIDNYQFHAISDEKDSQITGRYDTVPTGLLTYYDLWPKNEFLRKSFSNFKVEAKYSKLPKASWEKDINLYTLYFSGIPQKDGHPCDGIIRIETSPWEDIGLIEYMDSIMIVNQAFHLTKNNCADFGEQAIEYLIGKDLKADELVFFKFSTTPNGLFKAVAKLKDVKIIKDPGAKLKTRFWKHGIINRYFKRNNN